VVGSEQAVFFGLADSGPAAILFAGSQPARTRGLVLANTDAGSLATSDPSGGSEEEIATLTQFVIDSWGTEALARYLFPDVTRRDPYFGPWFARNQRLSMTPTRAARAFSHIPDVRQVLHLVRVPTLVLHRERFPAVPLERGRYLAEHIAGAQFSVLPGGDGWPFTDPGDPTDKGLQEIDQFLSGLTAVAVPDRALAAILFTDIVGSTERLAAIGDQAWRNLLATHDTLARTLVDQNNGRVVKMTGDGMLATFDGPGRAIRCALSLTEALRTVGLNIRAGLHTGEVEVMGDDIAGIGVHIAARVMERARSGDLVVSAAVPMLVAGSGLKFDDQGEHELKGVPGSWRLFSVVH
jgi:class 3 adenylate cyclase